MAFTDFGVIDDDILLLGEANFSFTISLLDYCDAQYVTTTCYDTYDVSKAIFNDTLDKNLSKLHDAKIKSIQFNVNAFKLGETFGPATFSKILFMFPHVCKKSNLKLNRQLIEQFLTSARRVLKPNGCVCVTLAKGQGGTRFEVDYVKTNDNWQLLRLANKCGFLLTDVRLFQIDKYELYKSAGFRNQSKGFNTVNSLIHKLELSLPLRSGDDMMKPYSAFGFYELDLTYMEKYLRHCEFLFGSPSSTHHPLVQLKHHLIRCLEAKFGSVQIYGNFVDTHFSCSANEEAYRLNEANLRFLSLSSDLSLYTRQTLYRSDLATLLPETDRVHVMNGLLLTTRNLNANSELNNLSYKMLGYSSGLTGVLDSVKQIIDELELDVEKNDGLLKVYQNNYVCIFELDLSVLSSAINHLSDSRVLYSNDKRLYGGPSRPLHVQQLAIECQTHIHDISFWYDKVTFDVYRFYDVVRETCGRLVKSIQQLDSYIDANNNRCALCYRLTYESCDYALDFDETVQLQLKVRDEIKSRLNVILR